MKNINKIIFFCFAFSCLFSGILSAQKIEQDISYLEKMHKKNPESAEIILELAYKYKETGDFNSALTFFKKGAEIQPENTDILFEVGVLLSWTGEYDTSIAYFKKILARVPDHYDAKLAMARVLSWQDKRKKALALCDEVIKENPSYIDAYEIKARIHTWNSNFKDARAMHEKILEIDPQNNQAKTGLVAVIAAEGNYGSAIGKYEKMIEENPENGLAHRELGRILSWKSEYDKAIFHLKKAIFIDPRDTQAREALARVYRWAGRYGEGINIQKDFLAQDNKNVRIILEIALLYDMWGKYREAISWYEKAHNLQPDNPQVNARLGILYSRNDRIDDAITSLQKTLKVRDNDVESLILLGRVYGWEQKIAESIALYHEAVRMDPSNQEAYIGLGRTYYYDDNWEKAKLQFRKALEINPLNKEAERELKKIGNLSKPHFTTRYDFFTFRNYDTQTSRYNEKISHTEISQAVDWSPISTLSAGVQYKRIAEREEDGNGITGYNLIGDEYSVQVSHKFYKEFSATGKLTSGKYKADNDDVYIMEKDKTIYAGFLYLQYEYGKWVATASYSREPYPVIWGNSLIVGDVKDAGSSWRYDYSNSLSLLAFYFNKMYFDKRHQKEHGLSIEYTPPFYKKCDMHYRYSAVTDPSETMHAIGAKFRDEWRTINYELSYVLETSSYLNTNTHSLEGFSYYDITDAVQINAQLTYEVERKEDKDKSIQAKLYVTYHF